MVPYTDPIAMYTEIAEDVELETLQIIRKCQFSGGPFVDRFERSIANYLGLEAAVGTSSGTDAITLALEALGVGDGDGVIMPNNANIGIAFGITRAGAKPILADVHPWTYLLDLESVEKHLRAKNKKIKIKAVVVTDQFGQMPDLNAFNTLCRKHKCFLIEDASHALSATHDYQNAGYFSDVTVASCGPEMNLWSMGQAGVVLTNNDNLAKVVKSKTNQGFDQNHHKYLGGSFQIDAIHAAQLYHSLQNLEDWTTRRRKVARFYNEVFTSEQRPAQHPNSKHSYHHYQFCCKDSEERGYLKLVLEEAHIGYALPGPLVSDSYTYMNIGTVTPTAYSLKDKLIALPVHPGMSANQALEVVRTVQSICR